MNEHTWEKLDADMRRDMAEEYIQERCPHEFVDILDFEIVNAGEDARISIICEKCGATQEHTLDLQEIIFDLEIGWEE